MVAQPAAQGRGYPAARHGADSVGASGRRFAAGDPDFRIVGAQAVNCASTIATSDTNKARVRGAGEGRVRHTPVKIDPGIPLQDLRRPREDSTIRRNTRCSPIRASEAGGVKLAANEKESCCLNSSRWSPRT